MKLLGLSSAFPPHVYTQRELWDAMAGSFSRHLQPKSVQLLEKLLTNDTGIATRRFFLPDPSLAFSFDAQTLNQRFESLAPALAAGALRPALQQAGIHAKDLDALFIATCTGYLCPGVSSHVAEALHLPPGAVLHDLVGLGCGAAIPLLRSARDFLAAHPGATVATIAVEICSAAFYVDDDPGVLVSLCLFGDGAAAAVWRHAPDEVGWHAGHFQSLHQPEHREKIRFVNAGGKLRNQLHRSVPILAARAVRDLHQREPVRHDQILAHTGGRDVLQAIEDHLPGVHLAESRSVLRDYGNLSSPCVLVALEKRLQQHTGDSCLWLTAFGAGFSAHACRLEKH